MRRKFIAGNWKMNLDWTSAVALAQEVKERTAAYPSVDVAVCPPSVYLDAVGRALAGSQVALGAQNVYHQPNGAFTGEISTAMLLNLGCRYVILGHSERRHLMNETNDAINQKAKAALTAGLLPIVCVGERLEEREAGRTGDVIATQFAGSLAGLSAEQLANVTIAYEPVWAIGTGKTATPEQAEEVHLDLRKLLTRRYNAQLAETVRIQYGGSVNAKNAADLLAQPNIDGALVGGASLNADDFLAIVAAGAR
jgi:triosephosphate isomerase